MRHSSDRPSDEDQTHCTWKYANKKVKILCKEAKLVANGNGVQTDFFLHSLTNRIIFANEVQTDLIIAWLQELTKSLKHSFCKWRTN